MSDIFLSYASADREAARTLAAALEQQGWSVWWDRRIPAGRNFADVIEEQLAAARCVIVLWSATSVASEWVQTEASDAKDRQRLVPVLIEKVKIPLEFRRLHAADLIGWRGEPAHTGFATLIGDLTGILGAPPARDAAAPPQLDATPKAGGEEKGREAEAPAREEAFAREEPRPPERAPAKRRDTTPTPPWIDDLPPSPSGGVSAGAQANRRLLIYGGAAVLALAVIIFLFFSFSGDEGSAGRSNVNIASASPATPTPRPLPPGNNNRTQPPNPERATRLAQLLRQMNATQERDRRAATDLLKAEFGSDPRAVEQALDLLDESRLRELSPQGLINVLFFLNNTDDAAWTPESVQKAERVTAALESRLLGRQASDALSKLKTRRTRIRSD